MWLRLRECPQLDRFALKTNIFWNVENHKDQWELVSPSRWPFLDNQVSTARWLKPNHSRHATSWDPVPRDAPQLWCRAGEAGSFLVCDERRRGSPVRAVTCWDRLRSQNLVELLVLGVMREGTWRDYDTLWSIGVSNQLSGSWVINRMELFSGFSDMIAFHPFSRWVSDNMLPDIP